MRSQKSPKSALCSDFSVLKSNNRVIIFIWMLWFALFFRFRRLSGERMPVKWCVCFHLALGLGFCVLIFQSAK